MKRDGTFLQRFSNAAQFLKYVLFGHKEVVSSIKIKGSRNFCKVTQEALLLLREKDSSSFDLTNRYLDLIVQSGWTSFSPSFQNEETGATLALGGKQIKDASKEWLACLLAYYGYCGKLYYDYKKNDKGSFRIPCTISYEKETRDFMYRCLSTIGGSYEELKYLSDFIDKSG